MKKKNDGILNYPIKIVIKPLVIFYRSIVQMRIFKLILVDI